MTPAAPDAASIRSMFDRLAPRYDLYNRLMSLGLDGRWRRKALEPIGEGMRVLDLGCGTGELSFLALKKVGGSGEVVGVDFSAPMLAVADAKRGRLNPQDGSSLRFELRRAEELPFEERPYDAVVSGFVLRNIYRQIDAILAGVYRSLKAGGRIRFLDITEPGDALCGTFWRAYMAGASALWGWMLFGKGSPRSYIAQSAARFVKPDEFALKLVRAGFREVRAQRWMMGSIVLYDAVKG